MFSIVMSKEELILHFQKRIAFYEGEVGRVEKDLAKEIPLGSARNLVPESILEQVEHRNRETKNNLEHLKSRADFFAFLGAHLAKNEYELSFEDMAHLEVEPNRYRLAC